MIRNLTARDMLRFQTCEQLLGYNQLTADERYAQARQAQQLRNFWFTATAFPDANGSPTNYATARTPTFSDPLVIADIISLFDLTTTLSIPLSFPLEVWEYGGLDRAVGLDYFGMSGPCQQRYLLKHEKNYSRLINNGVFPDDYIDLPPFYIGHVPRLLAPYQQLEFRWLDFGPDTLNNEIFSFCMQSGLRAVRALPADNPYSYFTTPTDADIKNYIANSRPETFFLEATLPLARFPAVGATVQIKTPQMERPLLILGAISNVEGVQAELIDESKYYVFTHVDPPRAGVPLRFKAPPLALWANNGDFRNTNLYNMWPVPHLLERGAQLIINLTNGLQPDVAGVFQDTILTRSEQAARIVFLCRTV